MPSGLLIRNVSTGPPGPVRIDGSVGIEGTIAGSAIQPLSDRRIRMEKRCISLSSVKVSHPG